MQGCCCLSPMRRATHAGLTPVRVAHICVGTDCARPCHIRTGTDWAVPIWLMARQWYVARCMSLARSGSHGACRTACCCLLRCMVHKPRRLSVIFGHVACRVLHAVMPSCAKAPAHLARGHATGGVVATVCPDPSQHFVAVQSSPLSAPRLRHPAAAVRIRPPICAPPSLSSGNACRPPSSVRAALPGPAAMRSGACGEQAHGAGVRAQWAKGQLNAV